MVNREFLKQMSNMYLYKVKFVTNIEAINEIRATFNVV